MNDILLDNCLSLLDKLILFNKNDYRVQNNLTLQRKVYFNWWNLTLRFGHIPCHDCTVQLGLPNTIYIKIDYMLSFGTPCWVHFRMDLILQQVFDPQYMGHFTGKWAKCYFRLRSFTFRFPCRLVWDFLVATSSSINAPYLSVCPSHFSGPILRVFTIHEIYRKKHIEGWNNIWLFSMSSVKFQSHTGLKKMTYCCILITFRAV